MACKTRCAPPCDASVQTRVKNHVSEAVFRLLPLERRTHSLQGAFSDLLLLSHCCDAVLQQSIAPGVNQMEWKHGSCKDNGFALAIKGSFIGTHEWVKM